MTAWIFLGVVIVWVVVATFALWYEEPPKPSSHEWWSKKHTPTISETELIEQLRKAWRDCK